VGFLKRHIITVSLVASIVGIALSILLSLFYSGNTPVTVLTLILASASSAILFPVLVGYYYDKVKEEEGGGAIWRVFKEFSDGGILRVFKDREEGLASENAVAELLQAFKDHHQGEVKLIGVTLRVFFNKPGRFYEAIRDIASAAESNASLAIRALISDPESPEVTNRAAIETPTKPDSPRRIIRASVDGIEYLQTNFPNATIEYRHYMEAPYCTLVMFPDRCFFSPNLLSKTVPVRLPMIVFSSGSHGYDMLKKYFTYLWQQKGTASHG